MTDRAERGRGILTPRDRAFLRGESSYDSQQRRNIRGDIRERVKNALLDFQLLYREIEDRDLELLLKDLDDPGEKSLLSIKHGSDVRDNGLELDDGLVYTVAFLYRCTEITGLTPETLFTQGIQLGAEDAIVTVEVTSPESLAERGLKKALEGKQLTTEESRAVTKLIQEQAEVGPAKSVDDENE